VFWVNIRPAKVIRGQCQGVGELADEGFLPAEQMDFRSSRAPVLFIEEVNSIVFEFVPVIYEAFAEQPDGFFSVSEFFEELGGGHQGIRKNLLPGTVTRIALVNGDEELAAFRIEDGGDVLDASAFAEAAADRRCFRLR